MTVHDFKRRSREADTPEIRRRTERFLAEKIEAQACRWTERGGRDDLRGIDVWALLPNQKQVGVDVKNNTWGEVRIEYVSRVGEGRVGWTVDDSKEMDYVLNLWPRWAWLIDFPHLKAVAKANKDKYLDLYGPHDAHSRSDSASWRTAFVPVPVGVLLYDIYGRSIAGVPLTKPRLCPSCNDEHPAGTTCAGGWAAWDMS